MTTTHTGPDHAPQEHGGATLAANLEALEQLVDRIASADIASEQLTYTGPVLGEAAVRAHRAVQRLQGKRMQWLTAEEADGRWALDGSRTFATHVAHTHKISQSAAKADVRLARQLRDEIGRFSTALRRGDIGMDQARIVARSALTSQARIAGLQQRVRDPDAAGDGGDAHDCGDHAQASDDASTGVAEERDERREDGGSTDCDGDGDGDCDCAGTGTGDGEVTMEQFLLTRAQGMRPENLRRLALHYAAVADPEADERGYCKAQEREFFDVTHTMDGYHLAGFLTEEHGQQVSAALTAVMAKPARGDHRSAGQRRAQGLADLSKVVLDQGLAGTAASVRPHVGVMIGFAEFTRVFNDATGHTGETVTARATDNGQVRPTAHHHDQHQQQQQQQQQNTALHASSRDNRSTDHRSASADLTPASVEDGGFDGEPPVWDWAAVLDSGPATWSDTTGPVPMQVLRRMVRCGDLYRVLFSPENEVLNHGRLHRTFTAGQRRAIVARDRHCTFPGCTAPPALCETHHAIVRWADNGNTDVSNGALLCFHHHDLVEAKQISMTRGDEHWQFFRPDGSQVHEGEPVGRRTPWKQRE